MSTQRRHFAGTEKVAILKRHLIDKVPVSDLCDELDIYPNQLYGWLKEFFENGHAAFDSPRPSKTLSRPRFSSLKPSSSARTKSWPSSWKRSPRKKKEMGSSEQMLGSPRYARHDRRFRSLLERQNRRPGRALPALDRHRLQQVLRLDP